MWDDDTSVKSGDWLMWNDRSVIRVETAVLYDEDPPHYLITVFQPCAVGTIRYYPHPMDRGKFRFATEKEILFALSMVC